MVLSLYNFCYFNYGLLLDSIILILPVESAISEPNGFRGICLVRLDITENQNL